MTPRTWIWSACAAIALLAASCGKPTPTPTQQPTAPPAQSVSAPASSVAPSAQSVVSAPAESILAHVRAVDADGKPISGMMPIASTEPNALSEPIARGPLTNAEGVSAFTIPGGQWLYVRAWDPDLKLFANSYFDVPPSGGNETRQMDVVMLPGAELEATLLRADGMPFSDVEAGLMLEHPTKGPWWPSKGKTNALGRVRFGKTPAGKYLVRLKLVGGESLELPETLLLPGQSTDLGPQTLQ